jgi:Acetyltransferase (GNAT) family
MDELRVVHARDLTSRQRVHVRQIYHQAFAPHHRVPFGELAAAGQGDILLAALEGAEPVGFAAARLLGVAGWTFLRYYGIAAHRRRTGLGQRFWRQFSPAAQAAGWPARIAFEVEDPAHMASQGARETAAARVAFWTRCECQVLPVTRYVMPDISGLGEPEPMLLMASEPATVTIAGPAVADLVLAIYQGRYELGPGHPLVIAALSSISGNR